MENRGECEGLGAQSRNSSTSPLTTHGHLELGTLLFHTMRPRAHFQKNEKLEHVSDEVIGSDGVNPGELRGGGEA